MYYENRYLFRFESSNGTTREIRVLHREAGDRARLVSSENDFLKDSNGLYLIVRSYRADQRPQGRAPIIKKEQNGPVHGTSLTFYAECQVDQEYLSFYTSDPQEYRVDVYDNSTLLWQGFITPELYSEPDIAPPYDVQVVATDGIGELKLYDFAPQGTVSLRAMLTYLLGHTGLSTDVNMVSSIKAGGRTGDATQLLEMTINLDYLEGKTCYEALTYLLDTLHATITRWGGSWLIVRETNITFTDGKVRYFDPEGNWALLDNSVQTLGKMYANSVWPVGQLSMVVNPAKNKVVVQAPWHPVTALQNPDMTSDASWDKYNGAAYDSVNGGYLLPYPSNGTGQIRQQISVAGLRVPTSISVRATASSSAYSGQVVPAQLGILLIYTVGSTSYHLRRGTDDAPMWVEGNLPSGVIPAGTPIDYQQTLTVWDSPRIGAEELKIENIPAFLETGSFRAGTLTVYIIGYCTTVYSVHLDVVLPKGYQDILRLDNGARGEGGTVEVAFGRADDETAYYAAFLQGVLLNAGVPIRLFQDANFDSSMNYLAFIARDYALSVALPRVSIKGTVYLEDAVTVPPLVFAKGGLNYWIQTWAWNMYEDELEIEAITLPAAQLTVSSETILESSDSKV